ncbi:MAG: nuclear transport factor 2 family protein [Pseudomonadota bacterium]|nr:nuclear transport factor 2 family protein [Pseudomonadota bacterium]
MSSTEDRNKAIIRHIYEASATNPNALAEFMHEEFVEYIPPILPWGGEYRDMNVFKTEVMPQVAAALDLSSLNLVSVAADGEHVAVLIRGRSSKGDALWIAEHWTLRDEKVTSLRVFYHDTRLLTD